MNLDAPANRSTADTTPAAWRRRLYGLLGDLPPRERPVRAETLRVEERPGYVIETLSLDLNGIEAVPAYFIRPRATSGPLPAVLYHHSHGGDYARGKQELIAGRSYLGQPPYADFLAAEGICALCIDAWCFGERATRSEMDTFKLMLWQGQVLWGMMVYDALRAAEYLRSRPEVNAHRTGTCGMSMGSTMSQWVAALDENISVCADLCCLTDYQALIDAHGLGEHGIYYYVPSLLKHFTAAQINALIAPRPHLSLAGEFDPLTPAAGLDRIDTELRAVYARQGAPEHWRLLRIPVAHEETPGMREQVRQFLRRYL
jgi:dienelactone hydrolase